VFNRLMQRSISHMGFTFRSAVTVSPSTVISPRPGEVPWNQSVEPATTRSHSCEGAVSTMSTPVAGTPSVAETTFP
jgi:hypothetical protein